MGSSSLIRRNGNRNHAKNHAKDNDQAQCIKDNLVSGILLALHPTNLSIDYPV